MKNCIARDSPEFWVVFLEKIMTKSILKFFLICFIACSSTIFCQAQENEQKQEKVEKLPKEDDNFFDQPTSDYSYKEAFVKMMLTLVGLIVLIVLSVWILRRVSHGRMKQMNYGRSVKIIERRPLSAKSILYLIEVSGKKVLIAESQLEVRRITSVDHLPLDEEE